MISNNLDILDYMKSKAIQLLKWSEKYTKTDMIYFAKGGFWLSIGSFVSNVSVFVIAIAFANLLPKEIYGTYKYVISIATMLSFFTLQGMSDSVTQSVARGYEKMFIEVTKTKMKWGLLGGFAGIGVAAYYYLNGNILLATSFAIIALFIPIWNTFNIYNPLLTGRKRFDISFKYHFVSQVFILISIVGALFLTDNLFILLITYFSSWSLVRIFFYFRTLRIYPLNNKVDSDVVSFGKHLSFAQIISAFAEQLDKILLWHFIGPVGLATYFFALAPVKVLGEPLKNIASLALPKLSTKHVDQIKETLLQKMSILFLLSIPVIAIYIFSAPYIYSLLFPQYLDSIIYSQLFALSLLLAPKMFIRQTLVAQKKKKELYQLQTIVPVVKIGLLLMLLPTYGILGAVVTLILVDFINLLTNLYLFRKV